MRKLRVFLLFCFCFKLNAQVGLNTSAPEPSSVLDITSANKGILIPRVSLISVNNTLAPINTPAAGLLVWNTNASVIGGRGIGYYYFNGIKWLLFEGKNSLDQGYDRGGNGLGRVINADSGAVLINGTDGIMITGTFGLGTSIDTDVTGAGTRMFFNPFKSSFRAGTVSGTQYNNANVGSYSFATGYDNSISGSRTFGANSTNSTSNIYASSIGFSNSSFGDKAFSSGFNTRAGGDSSFSTGFTTFAIGFNSFSGGQEVRANTINEVAFGYYPKVPAKTNSSGVLNVDSQSTFYTTDRAFAIGNGDAITKRNCFEVWKDGRVIINSSYTFPTTAGTNKQRLATNGGGTLSWKTVTGITQIPLYADDTAYSMTNTSPAVDVPGFEAAVIPTLFESLGNVKVKLVVRYSSLIGTQNLRLRVHDGTTQLTPIVTTSGWVNTTTAVGGVLESAWRNWNSATGKYEVHLSGFMSNAGESINITSAYLLIAPQ